MFYCLSSFGLEPGYLVLKIGDFLLCFSLIPGIFLGLGLKLLVGAREDLVTDLFQVDLWDGESRLLSAPRRDNCAVCGEGDSGT